MYDATSSQPGHTHAASRGRCAVPTVIITSNNTVTECVVSIFSTLGSADLDAIVPKGARFPFTKIVTFIRS